MVITRSGVTNVSNDDNGSGNEVFETPLKDSGKTPSSKLNLKRQLMRPRSHSFSSVRSESVIATHNPGYICSICKNSELLRSSTLDASIETLMGKLNSANKQFSESMSKIESLSLNIRHFY